jgi:hypothetical protein
VSLSSELGSIGSTLDDITRRITALADERVGTPDDATGAALVDVERALRTGMRRLERLRRDLGDA